MNKHIKKIVLIIVGSIVFSIGINYFAIPNQLSEGGVIGITVVLHYLFQWSPGLVSFILNIILLGVGYKFLERQMIFYTIFGVIASSFSLWLTEDLGTPIQTESLLAPIYAGLFVGTGLGVIFRAGATSGGTQILAMMMNKYFDWSIAKGILIFDLIVIGGSVFVIGQEKALLTLIAVYVGARAIDFIVDGLNIKKAVTIISNDPEHVLEQINDRMNRGVTVLQGHGGYTKHNKKVLYAVVDKQEAVKLHRIVDQVDPNAFIVTHDVRSAFGGGFK
ncbi:YitT family protein [Bacillus tianshenii]|nr:YitT family protein [Bacillus tianshenii]